MHHVSATHGRRRARTAIVALGSLTLLAVYPASQAAPTRSTSIALTGNGTRLVNVNHEADSVTLFDVKRGGRRLKKVAEIPVGQEPYCVAVDPRGGDIFVTNGADGTVSVIAPGSRRVVRVIPVGTEPRGCALTPDGERLFVANHTAGTVSIINTSSRRVINTIDLRVGGSLFNPFAIAITDRPGDNERVFVTDFYARLRLDATGREGFDDGKQGIVRSFRVNSPNNITTIPLSHIASGFTADRTNFCAATRPTAPPANETFCPGANINADPQDVFPNQFFSALIRGNRLFLPNIGAQPEPPVRFDVNVQALVHVVNTQNNQQVLNEHVNLNDQIDTEPVPASPTTSLGRLFGNDIVAIDATPNGGTFFIVSRGGNYVLRATLQGGQLTIGAPNTVRFKTGNIPTGIAVRGRFGYVNNEVGHSVSILDLNSNGNTIALNVSSSEPPKPGSHEHAVELGKLVFFTGLGVSDNGLVGQDLRAIDPLLFRGKQSNNAWSTCASCHPAG
ncbi:MAG: YncE family protein, partial [Gammaproteobacteria bacterium]